MRQLSWKDVPCWDINEEIRKAVKKTVATLPEEDLQAIRNSEVNVLEVTYSLEELGIDASIKLEDVWNYIDIPCIEVGHFVAASSEATLHHASHELAERRHGRPALFDYVRQTINACLVVVDKEKDIMDIYSDDEGYGWVVPLNSYPTVSDLISAEANFNNGSCIIEKKGA